ncbi:MAG TPA: hypothetical protein VMF89_09650, partial [Polyangiales bacterium]|nr:hypothetical protein [Polyangiales bacterium]
MLKEFRTMPGQSDRSAPRRDSHVAPALLAFVVLGTVGCDSQADASASEGEDVPHWYAVASNVFSPDTSTGYIIGTSTLEDEELSLRDAVEIAGGGMVYSAGDGSLYVGGFESTDLEQFTVGSDGSLKRGERVSFAAFGLTSGFNPNTVQFVDSTHAFIFTPDVIIAWNPEQMTLGEELPMPDLAREGYEASLGYTTFRRGDEIV